MRRCALCGRSPRDLPNRAPLAPQAIRKVDGNIVAADLDNMYEFADKDGDGKISFDEFKKIMLYQKPAETEEKK